MENKLNDLVDVSKTVLHLENLSDIINEIELYSDDYALKFMRYHMINTEQLTAKDTMTNLVSLHNFKKSLTNKKDDRLPSLPHMIKLIQDERDRRGVVINNILEKLQSIADDDKMDSGIRNYCMNIIIDVTGTKEL